MRTATLPSVRVTPEVRALAESVLKDGETLSMFVEDSVRRQAQIREEDRAFYARGLASLERVRAGEKTFTVAEVMQGLRDRVAKKREALALGAQNLAAAKVKQAALPRATGRRKSLA